MKEIFDTVSYNCSKIVTEKYSTSFSLATKMLAPSIRTDIYNIYGFVRFADEIVDSFHDYDKSTLFSKFEADLNEALTHKISLNPILNAFQHTYHQYGIPYELVSCFMNSMRADLTKKVYTTKEEYETYIHGSANVVGLMCLKVFVKGDNKKYETLKQSAMALGSAFQKVNFLRDLKDDSEILNRAYFPDVNLKQLNMASKTKIVKEILLDFEKAYKGIKSLPTEAKFGVYTAYRYYKRLLFKLQKTPPLQIQNVRIRVSNHEKISLLARSYIKYKLNLV